MLVLTRVEEEWIVISDDVSLTIVSVKGNRVRIGVDAPKDISIRLEEVAKTKPSHTKI